MERRNPFNFSPIFALFCLVFFFIIFLIMVTSGLMAQEEESKDSYCSYCCDYYWDYYFKAGPWLSSFEARSQAETKDEPATSGFPNQVDPFYLRLLEEGKTLYGQGKIAEAVKNLEIAAFGLIEDRPRLLEVYVYLVMGYYRLRDIERAAFFLSEIERLDLKPDLSSAKLTPSIYGEFIHTESLLWRLGIAALTEAQRKILGERKVKESERRARQEESKKKQEAAGQISLVTEDSPSALERLKKELSLPKLLAGKLPPAQPTLAHEIIKLEEELRRDSRNGVASLRLALIYEELGNWKKAQQVLKHYLKFVPDCAAHRFELGRVLFELQKPKEALAELQKASEVFTGDIAFHQIKGKIQEALNQKE